MERDRNLDIGPMDQGASWDSSVKMEKGGYGQQRKTRSLHIAQWSKKTRSDQLGLIHVWEALSKILEVQEVMRVHISSCISSTPMLKMLASFWKSFLSSFYFIDALKLQQPKKRSWLSCTTKCTKSTFGNDCHPFYFGRQNPDIRDLWLFHGPVHRELKCSDGSLWTTCSNNLLSHSSTYSLIQITGNLNFP